MKRKMDLALFDAQDALNLQIFIRTLTIFLLFSSKTSRKHY
jgi:hypothetical protein